MTKTRDLRKNSIDALLVRQVTRFGGVGKENRARRSKSREPKTVDDKMRPKTERGGQDCVGRFGTACAQFALGSARPDEGSRPSTGRSHVLPEDDVVDGQREQWPPRSYRVMIGLATG